MKKYSFPDSSIAFLTVILLVIIIITSPGSLPGIKRAVGIIKNID
jgi:Sec-independent protein translocase protein TatA